MKTRLIKWMTVSCVAAMVVAAGQAQAGVMMMTFDDTVDAGAIELPSPYVEDNLVLSGAGGEDIFVLINENPGVLGRDTDFLRFGEGIFTDSLHLTDGSSAPFSLTSLEYQYRFDAEPGFSAFVVTGHYATGGTISQTLTDRNWQTHYFSAAWNGLESVEFTTRHSEVALDTIVVNGPANVPEPTSLAIFATICLVACSRRRKP